MKPFTFVTTSTATTEEAAAKELAQQLAGKAGVAKVRGGVVYSTSTYDVAKLRSALAAAIPGVPFVGSTSCLGVGSPPASFSTGSSVAAWWLAGDGFRFGVAGGDKGEDAASLGKQIAEKALRAGGFAAREARFAIMHPTPGDEESLLAGISSVLPKETAVIGGSAADNDLSGKWASWTHESVTRAGAVLALSDWRWPLGITYLAGSTPEGKRGRVTRAQGRTLLEIDGRPAADVYNEWTNGKIAEFMERGGTVLAQTTFNALGSPRKVGVLEAFVLIHPERVLVPQRALTLFANVEQGQEIALMTSSELGLAERGASVARLALSRAKLDPRHVVGGLMVYCAGCMLAITRRIPQMLSSFEAAVGKVPYVSVFSFGEQGCAVPQKVDHGNLMTSVLLLSAE